MLDVGRGPFLVAVADRPAAVIHCAELPPEERLFDLVEARVDLFARAEPGWLRARCASWRRAARPSSSRSAAPRRAGASRPATTTAWGAFRGDRAGDRVVGRHRERRDHRRRAWRRWSARGRRAADRLASRLRAHAAARDAARHRRSLPRGAGRHRQDRDRGRGRRRSRYVCSSCWRSVPIARLRHRHGRVRRSPHRARGARIDAGVRLPGTGTRRPMSAAEHERLSRVTADAARTARAPLHLPYAVRAARAVSERSSRRAGARP